MKRRGVRILLYIFIIITGIFCYARISGKLKGERIFKEIVEEVRKNNLIIDSRQYKVKILECHTSPGGITCQNFYAVTRKGYKFKSKYFNNELNYYPYFDIYRDREFVYLGNIIKFFGLNPYVLDNFIYDKSKGNDFKKIEEIFRSYKRGKIKYNWRDLYLQCVDTKEKEKFKEYRSIPEYECKESDTVKIYKEYFSVPRELDKIDWDEYIRIHKIYPVLEFSSEGLTKVEVDEINRKIEQYYNKDLMYIYVLF